jgi:hypothetical protein
MTHRVIAAAALGLAIGAFKDEIPPQDLEKIRAYVIHRATQDRRLDGG